MKTLSLAAIFTLIISISAFGATLTYSPASLDVTLPAGSSYSAPLTVGILQPDRAYFIWFVNIVDGDLPAGWLTASPVSQLAFKFSPYVSSILTIKVPNDAPPGTYSGRVFAKGFSSHYYADPAEGMFVSVTVPSLCGGEPRLDIDSYGPEYLWPPNHSMTEVTVRGRVVLPKGCSLTEVGYVVDDEYGVYTSMGTFSVSESGDFSLALPLEASREGQDMDGRHYTVSLYAEDEAGTGRATFDVLVPHDQRDKLR